MRALQLGIATGVAGVVVAVGLLGPAVGVPTPAEILPHAPAADAVPGAQVDAGNPDVPDVPYADSGVGGSGYGGFGDGYGYGYGTYDDYDEYCDYYCE